MSLQYHLISNHINSKSNDYMAVSTNSTSYTLEDLFERMTRQGSGITKAEAMAVFEEITECMVRVLEEGNAITTPLININSSVRGVFADQEDTFDSDKHSVSINISTGTRLKDVGSDITPKKIESRGRIPEPLQFIDHGSSTKNEYVTAGGGARITGSLLKFDPDEPAQGIFFIDTDSGQEYRVQPPLLRNKPSELICMIPTLPPGKYRLEVRSIVFNTTKLRTGQLSSPLVVK